MNKIAKYALMLCFTGTLSISLAGNNQANWTNAGAVLQQNGHTNKGQILVISEKEQNMVERIESAMPLPNYQLKYYQRQDGTGFFVKKANYK